MKAYSIAMFLGGLACLLATGCGTKASPKSSATKIPWSRVKEVEVTADTEAEREGSGIGAGLISPGASHSQVISAWGVPQYILDSPADPEHKIWQYPHAVVVFQGTKVEQVLAR